MGPFSNWMRNEYDKMNEMEKAHKQVYKDLELDISWEEFLDIVEKGLEDEGGIEL